ncbi:hypothetical protein ACL6C3_14690 [Capilliphycus salinus ALCB114379]|uniref:hypothetical protein n=1 Tax=Capilliphycus salinus TaxID=2768948 RepID=UPI0039A7455E
MKLNDLCEIFETLSFPRVDEISHPEKAVVRQARDKISEAILNECFLSDCLFYELQLIESNRLRRGLVPFFIHPNLGIQFAFGYWQPGVTPGPHEHTAWTITAVCRNTLQVLTYDRDESYRRQELVPKNCFQALAGEVGYIYEPCIHEPRNNTHNWSFSLHITSPRDGEPLNDYVEPLSVLSFPGQSPVTSEEHPYFHVLRARQRERHLQQIVHILTTINTSQTSKLFQKCYELSSTATRRLINSIAPKFTPDVVPESQWILRKIHENMILNSYCEKDMVLLCLETPRGLQEMFRISNIAREAIELVAKEPIFNVKKIPGNLSDDEIIFLGEALENTGLFRRTCQ